MSCLACLKLVACIVSFCNGLSGLVTSLAFTGDVTWYELSNILLARFRSLACLLFVGCQSDKSDLSSTASRPAIGDITKVHLNKFRKVYWINGPGVWRFRKLPRGALFFSELQLQDRCTWVFNSIRKPSFNWSSGCRNGLGDQRLLWFQTALKLAHSSLCWIKAVKLYSKF